MFNILSEEAMQRFILIIFNFMFIAKISNILNNICV